MRLLSARCLRPAFTYTLIADNLPEETCVDGSPVTLS